MTLTSLPSPAVDSAELSRRVDGVCAVAEAHADRADEQAAFPVEVLAELRRTRLLGLMVPREHGGGGGTTGQLIDATMRLARADLASALIFAMHGQQVVALVSHATEGLRERVFPALGRGDLYLGSVTTETGKGGHLLSSDSIAAADDERLHLDREAPIVTGGAHADAYLVTVRSPGGSPAEVDLVYADRGQVSIEVTGGWDPLGMRATHSVPMHVVGDVPLDQVVGGRGGFRTVTTGVFGPLAHLGWSAAWLGSASGALSRVLQLIRSPQGRKQFDIASPLVLRQLAVVRERLDLVHAHLWRAVDTFDTRADLSAPSTQLLLNSLKTRAAQECFTAVDELVEVVGLRHGYLKGSPTRLERSFRDLRSASLNYANDRLRVTDGSLVLLDPGVHLV